MRKNKNNKDWTQSGIEYEMEGKPQWGDQVTIYEISHKKKNVSIIVLYVFKFIY